jgi:hypothetical protein
MGSNRPRLVSGSRDHTVKVWDIELGHELLSLPISDRNADPVSEVLVSPDGLRIAATDGNFDLGNSGKVVRVWSANPPPQLPAIDPDDSSLSTLERDLKRLCQCQWVNTDPQAAWMALTAKEQELTTGGKPWTKVVLDIQPRVRDLTPGEKSHSLQPTFFTEKDTKGGGMLHWLQGREENGKRYLVMRNKSEMEYKIEFEFVGDTLRVRGRYLHWESASGFTMAPEVFDGEYKAVPRE